MQQSQYLKHLQSNEYYFRPFQIFDKFFLAFYKATFTLTFDNIWPWTMYQFLINLVKYPTFFL